MAQDFTSPPVGTSDATKNAAPSVNGSTAFYRPNLIDATRWNQNWPYQLILLEVSGDKKNPIYKQVLAQPFTLPINPTDLNLNMPFATNLQATLDGIVEESNGAPFRDISFNGTTGININKNNAGGFNPRQVLEAIQSISTPIIAGTTTGTTQKILTGIVGTKPFTPNVNKGLTASTSDTNPFESSSIKPESTGYWQFRALQKWLEFYVELKKLNGLYKDSKGVEIDTKNLRLAFAIWKDEAVYLCTGVNFGLKRSAQNPMEYMYSLQLKAWKAIKYPSAKANELGDYQPIAARPNGMSDGLKRIENIDVNTQRDDALAEFKSAVAELKANF